MSFGASGSVRFDAGSHGRDQGIFWQAGQQKKSNKKFGYKKKEMKYPLRSTGPPEVTEVPKEINNNKKNARKQDFVKKNKENLMRTKDGISKDNGGYYTLTHKQLNTILQSVGKIASLRGEGVNIAIEQALALQNQVKDPLTNELKVDEAETTEREGQNKDSDNSDDKKGDVDGEDDSAETGKASQSPRIQGRNSEVRKSKDSDGQTTARSERKNRKSKKQKEVVTEEKETVAEAMENKAVDKEAEHRFSPPPIPRSHMTKAERLRQEMRNAEHKDVARDGQEKAPVEMGQTSDATMTEKRKGRNPLTNSGDELPTIKFHIPPLIPKAHLTLAEKKRLQWEIERGETINTTPSKKITTVLDDNVTPRGDKLTKEDNLDNQRDEGKQTTSEETPPIKMPIPKAHLSQAERKRLQWQLEKAEQDSSGGYDPWGRPGAGAPIRTNSGKPLADYKSRKEQALRISLETRQEPKEAPVSSPSVQEPTSTTQAPSRMMGSRNQITEPAAMRSSFAIGFIAPNEERFKSTKEEERRKWLEDLEKQKEERRLQKMAEKEKDRRYFEETWADKLSHPQHPPAPLPDQTASLTPRHADPQPSVVLSPRVGSAPQASAVGVNESTNYVRGQGSILDPSTRKEMEEKRRRHLEHQAAVLAQVEENQRLKRVERERKIQEELEEERKLQQERDLLQNQYKEEQKKSRLKEEARQQRLLELKNAMDEAQYNAQHEKHAKRMQHLQQGGHDIKRLQANIEANFTPRPTARHVEPTLVPGLDLTPRPWQPPPEVPPAATTQVTQPVPTQQSTGVHRYQHDPYTENRVLTPSVYRRPVADPLSPRRDFATQTDRDKLQDDVKREESEVSIVYKEKRQPVQNKKVRVISAENVDHNLDNKNRKPPMGKKGPVKITERPKWGTQKPGKVRKQSEKDPFYQRKNEERKERQAKRQRELLALVEANKRVIPGERGTEVPSGRGNAQEAARQEIGGQYRSEEDESDYPVNDRSRHYSKTETARSRRTQSPPAGWNRERSPAPTNNYRGDSRTTVVTTHARSPPIPAIRHKMDIWKDPREFDNDYHIDTHSYSNYHPPQQDQNPAKHQNSHYQDDLFEDAPFEASDFVPFMRTSEILDPGRAAVPVIVSRESSAVTRARKEYHKGQRPGNHGNQMEYYDDRKYQIATPLQKDPILNPNIVKGHPTPRQDLILQQLSHLKLNLMQRQRELETCMSPSDLNQPREETL